MAYPPDRLGELDIALVNLLCAQGLPGSEELDIPGTLATLDRWALAVLAITNHHFYQFKRNPAEFNNLEADYRMCWVITVLERELGVHYNLERARDLDFSNSKDQFIHGVVGSDNGGTCVSMPVAYTAVARRLGYPVRLVQAKAHLFSRWDDSMAGVRMNVDASGRGMNSHPDSRYLEWPAPITEEEVAKGYYLKSLTPSEELAVFLAARGHCLWDNNRFEEALVVYREAAKRMRTPDYDGFVALTEDVLAGRLPRTRFDGTPFKDPSPSTAGR